MHDAMVIPLPGAAAAPIANPNRGRGRLPKDIVCLTVARVRRREQRDAGRERKARTIDDLYSQVVLTGTPADEQRILAAFRIASENMRFAMMSAAVIAERSARGEFK